MLDQRMSALERANEVRIANKNFKQGMKKLDRPAAVGVVVGELVSPKPPVAALPVRTLLAAIPGVGDLTVDPLLARAGIANGHRRVRELTSRQRSALVSALRPVRQTGTFARVARPLRPSLTDLARGVLDVLMDGPASTQRVHDVLGRPDAFPVAVGVSLGQLRKRGFVARVGRGKWSITDAGRAALS